VKASDSVALAGSSAAALAIANGGGGLSSGNVLATQLSIVANLILAGAATEVYSVELGGFDTHAAQANTQSELLTQLDTGVSAFVDAVGATERGSETVVLVYTEFGRRVSANASAGTDHGWANVVLVAGHPVKGGFYGDPPSLTNLSEGNLVYTTDFRSVYATMFDQVLGVDPKGFLGGTFPRCRSSEPPGDSTHIPPAQWPGIRGIDAISRRGLPYGGLGMNSADRRPTVEGDPPRWEMGRRDMTKAPLVPTMPAPHSRRLVTRRRP